MFKPFAFLILATFSCGIVAAQTPQSVYSESSVYKPREFPGQNGKKKKEKVSKAKTDDDNKKNELPAAALNTANRIPVYVYDGQGKPIKDLRAEDFRVLVDDAEREIVKVETAVAPLDILLLVDTSPSTSYEMKEMKNFVTQLTQTFKPDDKIQIIQFNSEIRVLCEPTNDPEIIKKAIKKLEMGDGTSIYETVRTIFRKYAAGGEKTILLLSDGVDTTSQKADYASSLMEAEKYLSPVFPLYLYTFDTIPKNPSLRILPMIVNSPFPGSLPVSRSGARSGVTLEDYQVGLDFINDLATLSGGRAIQVKSLAAVKPADFAPLRELLAPHYFISVTPFDSSATGGRRAFKIRINRPNLKIQTRGSFLAQ